MMKARKLIAEMAYDLGDNPDWIDQGLKNKISKGKDFLSQNPAWPEKPKRRSGPPYNDEEPPERADPTSNYGELAASHAYNGILNKIKRYHGKNATGNGLNSVMNTGMRAFMMAMQIERNHSKELSELAVSLVLSFPELKDAEEAVKSGAIRIDAQLVPAQNMPKVGEINHCEDDPEKSDSNKKSNQSAMGYEEKSFTPEEADALGLGIDKIKDEYDTEANKRRFINMMIHGAAVNKNYAFNLVSKELNKIDPRLILYYGQMLSMAELSYWVTSEDTMAVYTQSGQQSSGTTEVVYNPAELKKSLDDMDSSEKGENSDAEQDEKNPEEPLGAQVVIHARATIFPVLVQELVKGFYEYLSMNEDDPSEITDYAHAKADTLANEQWSVMQGPAIWRHFNHLIVQANGFEYLPRIFRHIVTLPASEFNRVMKAVLSETPEGKHYITNLVNEIKSEETGQQAESLTKLLH
jgi:hypothetical protein